MDDVINNTLSHPRLSTPSRKIIAAIIICILLYLLLDGILTKYVRLVKTHEGFASGSIGTYNPPIIQAGEVSFIMPSYSVFATVTKFVPPDPINWMKAIEFKQKFKSAPIIQLNVIGLQTLTQANFTTQTNATEKAFRYTLNAIDVTTTGFKCAATINYSLFPNLFKIQWVAIGFANTPTYNIVYEVKSNISQIFPAGAGVNTTRISSAVDLVMPQPATASDLAPQNTLARRSSTIPSGFVTHVSTNTITVPAKINTTLMTPIVLMSIIPGRLNTSYHYNVGFSIKTTPVVDNTTTSSRFSIVTNTFRAIAASSPVTTLKASWLIIYAV